MGNTPSAFSQPNFKPSPPARPQKPSLPPLSVLEGVRISDDLVGRVRVSPSGKNDGLGEVAAAEICSAPASQATTPTSQAQISPKVNISSELLPRIKTANTPKSASSPVVVADYFDEQLQQKAPTESCREHQTTRIIGTSPLSPRRAVQTNQPPIPVRAVDSAYIDSLNLPSEPDTSLYSLADSNLGTGGGSSYIFAMSSRRSTSIRPRSVDMSETLLPAAGSPPGYLSSSMLASMNAARKRDMSSKNEASLVMKSAMSIAQAPLKNILMTAFMLYMVGSGVQIFSVITLAMAFWQPLKAILDVNKTFAKFQDSGVNITQAKLIFLIVNSSGLGIALWQCNRMGLLPHPAPYSASDIPPPSPFMTRCAQ